MSIPKKILEDALALPPTGKAELVDCLLASLDAPDKEIDQLWMEEVENRIDAYERGEMKALKIEEVLRLEARWLRWNDQQTYSRK